MTQPIDQTPSALETQVDGDHYTKMAIQPMEFSMANHLDACQHTIIKYVSRFRDKNGRRDLEKAKHVIDMLIEFELKPIANMPPIWDYAWAEIKTATGQLTREQRIWHSKAIEQGRNVAVWRSIREALRDLDLWRRG